MSAPVRPTLDRRSSTVPKRVSLLPKPSSLVLDASVLVAQHVQLTGTQPITIGSHSVLHPHCKISSAVAPVVLGEGCVIGERAKIGVGMSAEVDAESRRSSLASPRTSTVARESLRVEGVVLSKNIVVESNAIIEAAEVGEGSVIEVGAILGKGCLIGKHCTISGASVIPPYARLPDYTVVFGNSQQRINKTLQLRPEIVDAKEVVHAKQLDMFKKLISNNGAKWM